MACWNARALEASLALSKSKADEAAQTRDKLEWVESVLKSADGPDALFLLEVNGNVRDFKPPRRWFRLRGYDAVLLVGEPAEAGSTRHSNGIVAAVRSSTTVLVPPSQPPPTWPRALLLSPRAQSPRTVAAASHAAADGAGMPAQTRNAQLRVTTDGRAVREPHTVSVTGPGRVISARAWNAAMRAMHGNGRFTTACWNGRALEAALAISRSGTEEAAMTRRKLAWLETFLAREGDGPDLLFILEVNGNVHDFKPLRRWFRLRGYDAVFLVGEPAEEGGSKHSNGVVAAVRSSTTVLVPTDDSGKRAALFERVCCRHMRVVARAKEESLERVFHCMHGLHGPQRLQDAGLRCPATGRLLRGGEAELRWADQFRAAQERWLTDSNHYGFMLVGDLNRVPCTRWRSDEAGEVRSAATLNSDDLILRKASGFRCRCCAIAGEGEGSESIVGGTGEKMGQPGWTRRATRQGRFAPRRARLDVAVAFGGERGKWREHEPEFATDADGAALSDHAMVTWSTEKAPPAAPGDFRKLPVRLLKGSRAAECYHEAVGQARSEPWRDLAVAAESGGTSKLEAITAKLRIEAEVAAGTQKQEAERQARACANGRPDSPRGMYNSWMRRLREARRLRDAGEQIESVNSATLFHRLTGLCKVRDHALVNGGDAWAQVIARCRSEVVTSGRRARLKERAADRQLIKMARELEHCPDLGSRMAKVWRMISERKANAKLDTVFEGDRKGGPTMHYSDPGFGAELRNIGEAFVRALDEGSVPAAFTAWCETFDSQFDTVTGLDGEEWELEKEMSWELFLEVLHEMPRGKAAGDGGFTVELLQLASVEVQSAFFEAMISDVRGRVLPRQWHSVLYALLPKPAPNDSRVVSENREIALMPVDMKLFLQMVRRATYAKMVGRIAVEQAGWCAGVGCVDPSLWLSQIIQNSARLQQPLWILYIDLATFFPKIDRGIADVQALLKGLPPEVVELTALIFGSADNHSDSVACRYETAGGLGDRFNNWLGCLMGCVLSPDRAKLLLNSIIAAIDLVAKGVTLFGHSYDERARTLAHCVQVAFADDWVGCFQDEAQLRRAWEMWACWEAISGSEIGVKLWGKTVVTAVRWVDGKPVDGADPKLVRNAKPGQHGPPLLVPFMSAECAYKHLGLMKCADGSWKPSWKRLKKHFHVALARIRRMRKASHDELMLVGGALLGGLGGFYLSCHYATRKELNEIESLFVRIYDTKMGRPPGSPWAQIFSVSSAAAGEGNARRRPHLHEVGQTALYSNICNVMADVADSPWKLNARSSLALAMSRWGVCGDPATWPLDYLIPELERSLAKAKVRHLADAWLLIEAKAERRLLTLEGREHGLARRRLAAEGRWRIDDDSHNVLHASADHFASPASLQLFTPTAIGGLGMPCLGMAALMHAGALAVGNFCDTPFISGCRWMSDYGAARSRHPSLPKGSAAAKAWAAAISWMDSHGVLPTRPEPCRFARLAREPLTATSRILREWERPGGRSKLRERACAERGAAGETTTEQWKLLLAAEFGAVEKPPAVEWEHGGFERSELARGPSVFNLLEGDGTYKVEGGEARWRRRAAPPGSGDISVDADGFAVGWEKVFTEVTEAFTIDDEAWMCWAGGRRVEVAELDGLAPVVQLYVRARVRMGAVPVINSPEVCKSRKQLLNVWVCRRSFREMALWAARAAATDVYTLDASWEAVKSDEGIPQYDARGLPLMRGSRAAVHHSGRVHGGMLYEREGDNNYIGEAVAHLDYLGAVQTGARVVVMFDALSPVQAVERFRHRHNRVRQTFYCSELLETWRQSMQRAEVLVNVWRTSHIGDVYNELADVEAAAAMERPTVVPAPRAESMRHRSMRFSAHSRGPRQFLCELVKLESAEIVHATSKHTQYWEPGDLVIGEICGEHERLLDAVLADRCMLADKRTFRGVDSSLLAAQTGCPLNCKTAEGKPVPFTWSHACFACRGTALTAKRETYMGCVAGLCERVRGYGNGGYEAECVLRELRRLHKPGCKDTEPFTGLTFGGDLQLRRARRFVGRLFAGTLDPSVDKNPETIARARCAAAAGAELVRVAVAESRALRESVADEAKVMAATRRWGRRWRLRVIAGGPRRCAELRELLNAAAVAEREIDRQGEMGEICAADASSMRKRLRRELVAGGSEIRDRSDRARADFLSGDTTARIAIARDWMMVAVIRRWRWRRLRATLDDRAQRRDVRQLVKTQEWPMADSLLEGVLGVGCAAGARMPQWRVGGCVVDGARWAGAWEMARAARRAFDTAGGRKLLRRGPAQLSSACQRQKAVDAQLASDMETYRSTGTCNGVPRTTVFDPAASGTILVSCIGVRSRVAVRAKRAAAYRAELMAGVLAGVEGDDADRWAVRRVLEVAREGARRMALVEWEGPYPDEWIRVSSLTADLRKEAAALDKAKFPPRPARVHKVGARRSARATGVAAPHPRGESDSSAVEESEGERESVSEGESESEEESESENKCASVASGGEQEAGDAPAGGEGRTESGDTCFGCGAPYTWHVRHATFLLCDGGCGMGFVDGRTRASCPGCDVDICACCLPAAAARARSGKRSHGEAREDARVKARGAASAAQVPGSRASPLDSEAGDSAAPSSPSQDEDDGAGVFDRAFYRAHETARGLLAARTIAAAPAPDVVPVAPALAAPSACQAVRRFLAQAASDTAPVSAGALRLTPPARTEPRRRGPPLIFSALPSAAASAGPWPRTNPFERARRGARDSLPSRERSRSVSPLPPEVPASPRLPTAAADTSADDSPVAAPARPRPHRPSRYVPVYPVNRAPLPVDPRAPLPEPRVAPAAKKRRREAQHAASGESGSDAEDDGRDAPGSSVAGRAAAASELRPLPGAATRASSQRVSRSQTGSEDGGGQDRRAAVHPLAGRRTGPVATPEERAAASAAASRRIQTTKQAFRIADCDDRFPYAIAHVIAGNSRATAFMGGANGAKYHIDVLAFSSAEEADTAGDGLAWRYIEDCHVRQVLRSACRPSAGRREASAPPAAQAHRREPQRAAGAAIGSERERDGRDEPGSSIVATATTPSERMPPPGAATRASSQRVSVSQSGSEAARSAPMSGREDPRAAVQGSSQRAGVMHVRPVCGEATPLRSGKSVLRPRVARTEAMDGGENDPRVSQMTGAGEKRGTAAVAPKEEGPAKRRETRGEKRVCTEVRRSVRVSAMQRAGSSGS